MTAIRIGDTERDAAISALADHYAAGRLTKDEYDERAERANAARFNDDLAPLFADLPTPTPARHTAEPAPSRRRRVHPAMLAAPPLWFAPLLMIGAIALVAAVAVLITPWLLFAVFWFACAGLGGGGKSRHHHHRSWSRARQPWQRV